MNSRNATNEYPYLTFSAAAVKGMGKRAYQEDTYIIAERPDIPALLAMVADGMGGMQDGRNASRTAVGVVKKAFAHGDIRTDTSAFLLDAVTMANDAVYEKLHGDGGTTGIACIFTDGRMYYAGAGDSFLILKRGKVLYRLNRRQNLYYTLCLQQLREGKPDRTLAENHPDQRALVGYLGMEKFTDADMFLRPLPLLPGDALLLCSDGIGDVLDDDTLLSCLSAKDPETACRRLDESVIDASRRYQDNYTAVVIQCHRSKP